MRRSESKPEEARAESAFPRSTLFRIRGMRGEIRHENGAELARNVPLIVWRLFPDSRESRRMIPPLAASSVSVAAFRTIPDESPNRRITARRPPDVIEPLRESCVNKFN